MSVLDDAREQHLLRGSGMSAKPREVLERSAEPVGKLTNVELVRRCQTIGDERAWNEFVVRFNRFISVGVLRSLARLDSARMHRVDVELVDDLVQDVYLKLFSNARGVLSGFRGETEAAVLVYIGKTAISVVAEYLRQRRSLRRHAPVVSLDAILSGDLEIDPSVLARSMASGPSPEQIAIRKVLEREVAELLRWSRTGPHASRNAWVVQSFLFGDKTLAEIAEATGGDMTIDSVKSTLWRTSRKLRHHVARRETQAALRAARRTQVA